MGEETDITKVLHEHLITVVIVVILAIKKHAEYNRETRPTVVFNISRVLAMHQALCCTTAGMKLLNAHN